MKSLNLKSLLFLVATMLTGSEIMAHSGHGHFEHSPLHYIYSFQHAIGLVVAIAVGFTAYKLYKKIKA